MNKEAKIQNHFNNAVSSGIKLNEDQKEFFLKNGSFQFRPEGVTLDELLSLRWMYANCKGDLIDCWKN